MRGSSMESDTIASLLHRRPGRISTGRIQQRKKSACGRSYGSTGFHVIDPVKTRVSLKTAGRRASIASPSNFGPGFAGRPRRCYATQVNNMELKCPPPAQHRCISDTRPAARLTGNGEQHRNFIIWSVDAVKNGRYSADFAALKYCSMLAAARMHGSSMIHACSGMHDQATGFW